MKQATCIFVVCICIFSTGLYAQLAVTTRGYARIYQKPDTRSKILAVYDTARTIAVSGVAAYPTKYDRWFKVYTDGRKKKGWLCNGYVIYDDNYYAAVNALEAGMQNNKRRKRN